MSEPLFLCASIPLSKGGFQRWLKSVPLSAGDFSDWPIAFDDLPPSLPCGHATVKDALVSQLAGSLVDGDGFLLCRHDEALAELQVAACFRYGDSQETRTEVLGLCAMLRGVAVCYTAGTTAFIHVFDSGDHRTQVSIALEKRHSATRETMSACTPGWFDAWVGSLSEFDPETDLGAAVAPTLLRALKAVVNVGAAQATPERPYRYDLLFYTDGKQVYSHNGQVLSGAEPSSFRRLTAGSDNEAFYGDRHTLWYKGIGPMVRVQTRDPDTAVRGFRPGGADGRPLLLCGNTLWCEARLDYPDRHKSKAHCEQNRAAIQARGGIVTSEAVYDMMWLQPTQVDGATFAHVEDYVFGDLQRVYWIDGDNGISILEGEAPDTFRRVGEVLCGKHHALLWSTRLDARLDCSTLRYLGGERHQGGSTYADATQLCYLSHMHWNSIILEGADRDHYARAPFDPKLSYDGRYVWYDGNRVVGADGATVSPCEDIGTSQFWKDARRVYAGAQVLKGVDPQRFKVYPRSAYARHGGDVYCGKKRVSGADADSFEVIDFGYARDAYRHYRYGVPEDN